MEDRVASQGALARSSVQMGWQGWRPLSNISAVDPRRDTLAESSGPSHSVPRPAFGGAMRTLLRVRRKRAFGAGRSSTALPARLEERAPGSLHFSMGEPSWPLWRCDDRNQGRLGAEGTMARAGNVKLGSGVRISSGKVSSSWKEVLRRASSPASWPGGRSANIHRMRSQSRTTPLPVPCYQSPCSIPSDAIFSILPPRSSNE